MKKALALVLALVLALSMAVSAFAAVTVDGLVELTPSNKTTSDEIDIEVVDAYDWAKIFYVSEAGTYYIALDGADYKDIKVTANGCVDAELVKYDPATMNVWGMEIVFDITYKGEAMGDPHFFTADGVNAESTDKYDLAVEYAHDLNDEKKVSFYDVEVRNNVNIIKVTVDDNYTAHYEEGTIKIEAVLNKKPVSTTLELVNDVVIFEYEEVKWAAGHYDDEDGAALELGEKGYSDYWTDLLGYDVDNDNEYDYEDLRREEGALVVSTTAFRAIEGKNLKLDVYNEDDVEISVTLKEIAAGQKGVNFYATFDAEWDDDGDGVWERNEDLESLSFGFEGNQVVKGEYEIVVDLPIDYFELRELFGLKVEEEDKITYYIVDEDGKVVGEMPIDYMTLDLSKNVKFSIKGENDTLGYYTLCLEVPAAETETEENPNTGAESVVGVVAALAVVSVATAAAVSLKK